MLAISGHLSYHVPMFDMTINSQHLIATENKHRTVMCHEPPEKTVKLESLILTTWPLNIASFINWGKMHFTFWYKFVQFYTICVIVIA